MTLQAHVLRPSRLLAVLVLFVLTAYLFDASRLLPATRTKQELGTGLTSWNLVFTTSTAQAQPVPKVTAVSSVSQSEPTSNMTTTTFSLSSDLQQRKTILLERLRSVAQDDRPIVMIMGNEAGDTDSIASAILASHLLSVSDKFAAQFHAHTTFVPLVQQRRADLPLRAENQLILDLLQVNAEDLLFLDDLSDASQMQRSDLFLGLTDHPKLSASFWQPYSYFQDRVQVIFDHHADDGAHKNAVIRVLKGPENGAVGSAISVVVDAFKGDGSIDHLPSSLADLAVSAVLIDTDNLRPLPKGKATEIDLEAARNLLNCSSVGRPGTSFAQSAAKLSGADQGEVDAKAAVEIEEQKGEPVADQVQESVREQASKYFEVLVQKKLDVSRLGTRDLLRRDYKESVAEPGIGESTASLRAGFSSVPVGLSDWVHERHGDGDERWSGYWRALREWMEERKLDVAVIGTSFREPGESGTLEERAKNGKHRRELVLAYSGGHGASNAAASSVFSSLVRALEADEYATTVGNDGSQQLLLEAPWKGSRRVASTGKRERVGGLDKDGRYSSQSATETFIAVWRQQNARASRKIYLPAVMYALKTASRGRGI